MTFAAFLLFGYLLGSVSFAVLVSRAFRLADPRTFGSGNPGATNVLRSGHKSAALLTLLGQGILAVLAGARRQGNPIYALFLIVTRPVMRAVRMVTPGAMRASNATPGGMQVRIIGAASAHQLAGAVV